MKTCGGSILWISCTPPHHPSHDQVDHKGAPFQWAPQCGMVLTIDEHHQSVGTLFTHHILRRIEPIQGWQVWPTVAQPQ